ncbi:MAG: ABC transporter ATP-binding protein [Candidatus Delongbacteria bacterium]|nr:ABC transporter ATP-binding protein [Candidatus Cloacimonadota bacterium]MCB9474894.1 ABC transporter ATP-binding protein [Candidatus Delongbacteria bacterium]
MLCLEDIEKVYRTDRIETQALSRISLDVRAGEFLSIMGPSGSGKSTLLNIMGLLDLPSSGRVLLEGKDVSRQRDRELARLRNRTIGFIFQSFHLVSDLSVLDNVEIPLLYRSMNGRERRASAQAALERVGLAARMSHTPGQLSGGQQQRVAIARAIVGQPALLLADEPTGNLDSVMGREIMEILLELNRAGTTIIMVTHDQQMADLTQRCVRLHDGRQVHQEALAC